MVYSEVVEITPKMAVALLENMVENRSVSERIVKRYAEDMRNGRWMVTNQGIGINEEGKLFDGQHRLWAIIEANVPIQMMVSRGFKKEAVYGVDGGRARSDADRVIISGMSSWVKTKEVAIVRMMLITHAHSRVTETSLATVVDVAHKYEPEFKLVNSWFASHAKGVSACPVRAAVVLALINGIDRQAAEHFVGVLQSGISVFPYDTAIIRFRDFVTQQRVRQTGSSGRVIIMKYAQRALKAVQDKQRITKLVEPSDFIWKLPLEGDTE